MPKLRLGHLQRRSLGVQQRAMRVANALDKALELISINAVYGEYTA